MEVFLYNSTVCRLCGEENDSGTLLYTPEENNQSLSEIINTYLPIKVSDDGQLPRTICPGCTIQLEATVEFMNLIINGQKVIRELHQREKQYKRTILKSTEADDVITESIVYEINTSDGIYHVEHPITLQVAGRQHPKRKRGRPPKKQKTPEEIAEEAAAKQKVLEERKSGSQEEVCGKRRRKTPTRFREVVQGKELDRIFKEEGVTDGDESESETKPNIGVKVKDEVVKEPEVIGHLATTGEMVVVVKGKGRGRPKGRMRPTVSRCAICGMEFSCSGRYMSHVAQHGPVCYQCGGCSQTFDTRLQFETHQQTTGHSGLNVLQPEEEKKDDMPQPKEQPKQETIENSDPVEVKITVTEYTDPVDVNDNPTEVIGEMPSLPVLDVNVKPDDDDEGDELLNSLVGDDDKVQEEAPSDPVESNKENTEPDKGPLAQTEDQSAADLIPKAETVAEPKEKNKLKCPHCEKLFSSKQSKSLHIKAVHKGEKPYVCGECGARFAYPRSLALHAVSHRRNRPQPRRYACDLCGKVLNHPSSVVYHKQAEHEGQRYVCNKCGKTFKHRQLLQRHQLVHSQARPYSCKVCDSAFKTKANLMNHQLLHSGIKKFTCEICKAKFAHKTSLTLHMRWHTGTKPYACNLCGKRFSQKGNLCEHARIHTGEKPFRCELCPRRFTTASQCRLHAARHRNDKPYACTHCPKSFVSAGSRAAHWRRACGAAEGSDNKQNTEVNKQVSLLVNEKQQDFERTATILAEERNVSVTEFSQDENSQGSAEMDERVIYVAYDVSEPEHSFHILDPEQAASLAGSKVLTSCELYSGSSVILPRAELTSDPDLAAGADLAPDAALTGTLPAIAAAPAQLAIPMPSPIVINDDRMTVTDESGNPLHLTMADGTRLAITSSDGKSLQVVTTDGHTIPVEINGFAEDSDLVGSPSVMQHLDLDKTIDAEVSSPVTHYFTIV